MYSKFMLNRMLVRNYATKIDPKTYFTPEGHGSSPKIAKFWENMAYFVAFPAFILAGINAYIKTKEEDEHNHRPEFIPYDHLRIRTKRLPWGDGNHSFFHHPYRNALPDGYETDEP